MIRPRELNGIRASSVTGTRIELTPRVSARVYSSLAVNSQRSNTRRAGGTGGGETGGGDTSGASRRRGPLVPFAMVQEASQSVD